MKKRKKPDKKELARMKVMSDMGLSNNAIGEKLGKSKNTVKKYLESDVYNDPAIQEMIEVIRAKELADLYLLNAKARNNLHDMLDKKKGGMIPTIALMDRSFQQRRLLEGQSTSVSLISIIEQAAGRLGLPKRTGDDAKVIDAEATEIPPSSEKPADSR